MRKVRIPNKLICDDTLSLSARRLGAFLCAASNRLGVTRKSLAMLSGLSGLSVSTVRSATEELERGGYLTRQRTYRYDGARHHLVYDRTLYQIHKYLPGGFTLVPSDVLFKRKLSNAAFLLALYLCLQGADRGRAFPSIRQMVTAIGVARSTICRALQQLKTAAVFLVRHCIRHDRTHAANSYFYLHAIKRAILPALGLPALKLYTFLADRFNLSGSPKFTKPVIRLR